MSETKPDQMKITQSFCMLTNGQDAKQHFSSVSKLEKISVFISHCILSLVMFLNYHLKRKRKRILMNIEYRNSPRKSM